MLKCFGALITGMAILSPIVGAQDRLGETREALAKWVETRQIISATTADWQTDKETLEQTVKLFERELASLNDQMSRVSTNSAQVDIERAHAQAEQKELNAALDKVTALVAGLEEKLTSLVPAFPPPLTERIQPLLKNIPTDPAKAKASGLQRMQNVVGIINEVDKFNSTVTVVNEVQKNPTGAEVQVETMYVGLAQAYFVDKSGEYAGVGVPSAKGWQWTPRQELSSVIQRSLAMYKNAAPAAFVSLPVQIK